MAGSTNKELIERFITEVWNENKLDLLDEYLAPDYYDFTYEPRNREGLENILKLMNAAFPGHESIIEEIAADGETVGVCMTMRGTHTGIPFRGVPASGRPFEVALYRFFQVRDGKILSHRGLLDLPSLFQQLGANS